MTKHRDLAYGDRFPEHWVDALGEYMSTMCSGNFRLELNSSTSVKVVAGVDNDQVTLGIQGKWRYNTATVTAAHPGGAAGTHDVFATTGANAFSFNPTPPPNELDSTDYRFGLEIRTSGVPSTAHYRKIGYVIWDGSQIVQITQTVGAVSSTVWPGSVATSGIGDAAVDGTALYYTRSDHKHLVTRVQSGSHAARPASATQGRLYYNTSKDELQRDSGSVWRTLNRPRKMTASDFGSITNVEDGDEIDLVVDATGGVIWRFAYRAASASSYKWEFVGGPPLVAEIVTREALTATTYTNLATTGPAVGLPRPGDYVVKIGCDLYASSGPVANSLYYMSYAIGAAAADDADAARTGLDPTLLQSEMTRVRLKTGLTTVTLTAKYRKATGSSDIELENRMISALPVRIS